MTYYCLGCWKAMAVCRKSGCSSDYTVTQYLGAWFAMPHPAFKEEK